MLTDAEREVAAKCAEKYPAGVPEDRWGHGDLAHVDPKAIQDQPQAALEYG